VANYFKGEIIVGKDLMVMQRGEGETIVKVKLLLAVMTAALGFASARPAQSQDLASQIVGVWKYVSLNNKEVATGKITNPLGEKPIGYIVYTKGGRVIFTVVGDKRPQPAGSSATDAERVGLFNTLSAGSGTYKIEGDTGMATYDSSWHQLWTGTTQKRTYAISGNKLTITSAPTKLADGNEVIFEVVLERAE
jgi:Lipocalin-like domain